MNARRLVVSLVLLALVNNVLVLAGPKVKTEGQAANLVSLKHETAGALTRVLIEASAPPLYTVFRPTDRLIIVDLPGSEGSQLANEYAVKSSLVDSILVRKATSDGATGAGPGRVLTRIEISVRGEVNDRSILSGNTLVIEMAPAKSAEKAGGPVSQETTSAKANDGNAQLPGVYVHPVPVRARGAESTPERAQSRPAALKPATLVNAVRSEVADGGIRVVVDADGAAQFKDFVLSDPWRIVVDITGVRTAFGNKVMAVGAASVERVRVGQPNSNVVRIVLDTSSKLTYRVVREGAQLVIAVGNAGAARNGSVKPAGEVKVAGQRVENQKETPQPLAGAASNLIAQANKPAQGGSSQRVTPQPNPRLPQPVQPAPGTSNSARETIIQPAATSPVRSAMDVQRPASPQSNLSTSAASQGARSRAELAFCDSGYAGGLISFDLRSGVDIRDMLRFISQQYGVNFIVDKSVGAVPVDIRVTDIPWNQVIESVLRANRLGAVCESNGRIIRIATLAAVKEEEEQQRAIREEQAKQIPLVTKILHLKYARAGGDLGNTGSGSSGRGGGGGQSQGKGLMTIANSRLSPRGRIEEDPRTNSLIVTDLPEYVQVIEDIIAKLDKPEPQVEIEARIVIASRNFLRDIGTELAGGAINRDKGTAGLLATSPVQFSGGGLAPGGAGAAGAGGAGGGAGNGSDAGGAGAGQSKGLGPNLIGPFASEALRSGVVNTVLSLTTGAIGTGILSMALSASETKGQIRTIASPRITAQDNQTAEIVNGVQIPVQTVSNNTITTTFVTAALRLEITPQIVEETGEVLMHVVAENNTVNFALANQFNNGTPGINTQSAQSIVRVQDGGTTVMGGINIDTEGHTVNRTPGVSRLPLVGELFKRRSTRREFDEILFFVTPRIVRGDGTVGPRNLSPQRSANEGVQANPLGTQRAATSTSAPAQGNLNAQKPSQPAGQAKTSTSAKGGS